MPERYYVQLQNGSFVGPSTAREIQEAYGAHKVGWNFSVFLAEGASPAPGSTAWGTVGALVDSSVRHPYEALDAYAGLLAVVGWIVITLAVFAGAYGLLSEAPAATKVIDVLVAVALAVMGLGVVASGQFLRCIRAIQTDVRSIAAQLATKQAAA